MREEDDDASGFDMPQFWERRGGCGGELRGRHDERGARRDGRQGLGWPQEARGSRRLQISDFLFCTSTASLPFDVLVPRLLVSPPKF